MSKDERRTEPDIGAGDIPLEFCDGQRVILQTSLAACRAVCRLPGSWQGAYERCRDADLGTLVRVVEIGIGKSAKELEDLIYKTGLFRVSEPCMYYLANIGNGGRPPKVVKTEGDDNPLAEAEASTPESTTTGS